MINLESLIGFIRRGLQAPETEGEIFQFVLPERVTEMNWKEMTEADRINATGRLYRLVAVRYASSARPEGWLEWELDV